MDLFHTSLMFMSLSIYSYVFIGQLDILLSEGHTQILCPFFFSAGLPVFYIDLWSTLHMSPGYESLTDIHILQIYFTNLGFIFSLL